MSGKKYYLYRAAVTRYADSLYYEPGDRRRSHNRCHKIITRRLCGIGEDTHRNYLHLSEDRLTDYRLPPDLKCLLQLYVYLRTHFPAGATARILGTLCRTAATGFEQAKNLSSGKTVTAARFVECLFGDIKKRENPERDE